MSKHKHSYILGGIFLLNLLLRAYFIFFGYITTDEGIAFYNTKLAYSGLKPFINYNGWNSLINDYLMGLPRLIMSPTIFSQRFFACMIAILVFILTLKISRILGKNQIIPSALFLTLASPTYLYFSNLPYSFQTMTLFLLCSLFFLSQRLNKASSFKHDYLALLFIILSVLIRSQMLPVAFLIWGYLILKERKVVYAVKLSLVGVFTFFLLLLPFLLASWEHTIYALFWPFWAGKILLYVASIPPRSLTRLINFGLEFLRDYGILTIIIVSGFIINFKSNKKISKPIQFIGLCLLIEVVFVATAFIHHPAEASYIYPTIPLLSFLAAYFLDIMLKQVTSTTKNFIYLMVISLVLNNFLLYPHFKLMQTSPTRIHQTPFDRLEKITQYVQINTRPHDEILTFYLPLATTANRPIPTNFNEGAGSISILGDAFAEKYHLITLAQLQSYIKERKAKLIIFPSTATYYFGQTDTERRQLFELIEMNYPDKKEFTEFKTIDGSNAKALLIYRLPD